MQSIHRFKRFLAASDFFNSSSLLRFQKENQYKTLTGGLISLSIIITITIAFARDIIITFQRTSISVTSNILKAEKPTNSQITLSSPQNQMFVIFLDGIVQSRRDPLRFFDISARFQQVTSYQNNQSFQVDTINLVQCTSQHWKDLPAPHTLLQLDKMYCPEIGKSSNIFGRISSGNYKKISIMVTQCTQNAIAYPPCANQAQMQQFWAQLNGAVVFKFYYINSILNLDNPIYKQQYFDDKAYSFIGPTLGADITLEIAEYSITTDLSIWPFADEVVDNGLFYPSGMDLKYFPKTSASSTYLQLHLVKSTDKYIYDRKVQKLSTIFSYIGGVISSILAALFVLNSYTSFAYQISIANEIFQDLKKKQKQSDGTNEEVQFKDKGQVKDELSNNTNIKVGVWLFIKYNLHGFFKRNMKKYFYQSRMDYLGEYQKQISKQLDIKRLIKRIIFLQHCIIHFYDKDTLKQLVLNQPNSLKVIKQNRISMENSDQSNLSNCSGSVIDKNDKNSQIQDQQYNLEDQISVQAFKKDDNFNEQKASNIDKDKQPCEISASALIKQQMSDGISQINLQKSIKKIDLIPKAATLGIRFKNGKSQRQNNVCQVPVTFYQDQHSQQEQYS